MHLKTIKKALKDLIVRRIRMKISPQEIGDKQPLFGEEEGGLGLDSIEALEIIVGIESEFGVGIKEDEETIAQFYSVDTLARLIKKLKEGQGV
ncbi:MAG: acyl carrier protein [Candidatus Tectomicrobia bacterium]|nr:acyl carrier protein [Candidatus Tectomicrobia bacterium]